MENWKAMYEERTRQCDASDKEIDQLRAELDRTKELLKRQYGATEFLRGAVQERSNGETAAKTEAAQLADVIAQTQELEQLARAQLDAATRAPRKGRR